MPNSSNVQIRLGDNYWLNVRDANRALPDNRLVDEVELTQFLSQCYVYVTRRVAPERVLLATYREEKRVLQNFLANQSVVDETIRGAQAHQAVMHYNYRQLMRAHLQSNVLRDVESATDQQMYRYATVGYDLDAFIEHLGEEDSERVLSRNGHQVPIATWTPSGDWDDRTSFRPDVLRDYLTGQVPDMDYPGRDELAIHYLASHTPPQVEGSTGKISFSKEYSNTNEIYIADNTFLELGSERKKMNYAERLYTVGKWLSGGSMIVTAGVVAAAVAMAVILALTIGTAGIALPVLGGIAAFVIVGSLIFSFASAFFTVRQRNKQESHSNRIDRLQVERCNDMNAHRIHEEIVRIENRLYDDLIMRPMSEMPPEYDVDIPPNERVPAYTEEIPVGDLPPSYQDSNSPVGMV